jgi:hypothetical protein
MDVEHTWHVLLKQIVNVQANVGATSVKIDDLKNIFVSGLHTMQS